MIKFNCAIEEKDSITIEKNEQRVKFKINSYNGVSIICIDNDQLEELKNYLNENDTVNQKETTS